MVLAVEIRFPAAIRKRIHFTSRQHNDRELRHSKQEMPASWIHCRIAPKKQDFSSWYDPGMPERVGKQSIRTERPITSNFDRDRIVFGASATEPPDQQLWTAITP